jgi:ribosome maturation factor RimP
MTDNSQTIKAGVDVDRVRAALAPVLVAHGVALVDLEWGTDRGSWTLRLFIEREDSTAAGGGVTLVDCSEVSRDASAVLDVADLIPHHYNLEVSSPGLDRKLRTEAEFARFMGKTVKVKLKTAAPDGQKLLRGHLESAPPGRVAVLVDGKRIEVAFDSVEDAHLVFELEAQPKPKKGARPAKAKRGKEPRASKRT